MPYPHPFNFRCGIPGNILAATLFMSMKIIFQIWPMWLTQIKYWQQGTFPAVEMDQRQLTCFLHGNFTTLTCPILHVRFMDMHYLHDNIVTKACTSLFLVVGMELCQWTTCVGIKWVAIGVHRLCFCVEFLLHVGCILS